MAASKIIAPKGEIKFHDLPGSLVRLNLLPAFIGNGQIKGRSEFGSGLLLIFDEEIIAASWSPNGDEDHLGDKAMEYWSNVPDLIIDAEILDKDVVHALPLIWSDEKTKVELKHSWLVDLKEFIADNASKKEMVAIILEDSANYGVSLYVAGKHILSYIGGSEVSKDPQFIHGFDFNKTTNVRVKAVPLSHFWKPLTRPSIWAVESNEREEDNSKQAGIVELPQLPEEVLELPAQDLDATPLEEVREVVPVDVELDDEFEQAPVVKEPIPLIEPYASTDDEEELTSNNDAQNEDEDLIDMRPINKPKSSSSGEIDAGVIPQEAIREEVERQKALQEHKTELAVAMSSPLDLKTAEKLRIIVRDRLPKQAASAVIELVNSCLRDEVNLENIIQQTSNLKLHTVTQRQINELIQEWTEVVRL